jgi:CubicO group peptidase (beta-lactamase class C family)
MNRVHAIGRLAASLLLAGCGASPMSPGPSVVDLPTASSAPAPTASPQATAGPQATASPVPFTIVEFPALPTMPLDADVSARLQRSLEAALAAHGGGAITAVVLVGDHGMWTGLAVRPGSTAPAPGTPWTTGSIAKTITAAEVMRLSEHGKLDLDAPAASLFGAGVAADTNGATVRNLLMMRSGLTHHDPPGTVWEYSNGDYALLGRVIEGVTGKPLAKALVADILDVPGVTGIALPPGGTVDNAAGPFDADPLSLATWGYAFFGGAVVAETSLRRMVTFDENTYGMGVFDFSTDYGFAAAGHLGIDEPDSAAMVAFPDDRVVILTMGSRATWQQSYAALQALRSALSGLAG